jgi:PAS domain-containing protein
MRRHSTKSNWEALYLRRDAKRRLEAGTAPPSQGLALDRDALSVLFAMASDPVRSSDAYRLLQELQVHQVEIDMQREELENNEREMGRELALYTALFEITPTATLVTTMEGRIIEANPAAATLFNTRHEELGGRPLDDFLTLQNHATWSGLLWKLKAGNTIARCDVLVGDAAHAELAQTLSANYLPEGGVLLMTLASRDPAPHDIRHPI